MESLRRAYGIAEPVRRGMELKIVRDGTFRPAVLGGLKGGNVHEDILVLGGRDTEIGWEDVFQGKFVPCIRRDVGGVTSWITVKTTEGYVVD